MLRKIREAQSAEDEGFTLIELLVVVIIIGILAAIAIPVFLNQRNKARNAAANSDLRNLITAQEAYYTDADEYTSGADTDAVTAALGTNGFTASNGVMHCTDENGASFVAATKHETGTLYYFYNSSLGQIEKNVNLPTTGFCDPA